MVLGNIRHLKDHGPVPVDDLPLDVTTTQRAEGLYIMKLRSSRSRGEQGIGRPPVSRISTTNMAPSGGAGVPRSEPWPHGREILTWADQPVRKSRPHLELSGVGCAQRLLRFESGCPVIGAIKARQNRVRSARGGFHALYGRSHQ